jgi:hypothetical protein
MIHHGYGRKLYQSLYMNKKKPIALIFVRHYKPGYKAGGPTRSLINIIECCKHKIDFRIVCLSNDHNSSKQYEKIKVNEWNNKYKIKIFYVNKKKVKNIFFYIKIFKQVNPNFIYLNSFFDLYFSIFPILVNNLLNKIPILLAPRGEFSLGALSLKSFKKKLYIYISSFLNFHNMVDWHATSKYERSDIKKNGFGKNNKIYLASNISLFNKKKINYKKKEKGFLNIILPARISMMKNIYFAVELICRLNNKKINFDIYGTIEDDAYWKKCLSLINSSSESNIRYCGEYSGKMLDAKFAMYDLMFLPTMGENFGHSILESFARGLPVLISNNTPWTKLNKFNVGFDIDLNKPEVFISKIDFFLNMNNHDLLVMRKNCVNYFNKIINIQNIISDYDYIFSNQIKRNNLCK